MGSRAANTTGLSRREAVNQSLVTMHSMSSVNSKGTPKSERTKEQVVVRETGDHDLGKFTRDMREMFKEYDEKMSVRITKLEEKFTGMFDELKRDINSIRVDVYDTKNDVTALKSKVQGIEENISFQNERLEKKHEEYEDLIEKHKSELREMNEKFLMQEKHDRRYNLLFYGFLEKENEDLKTTMKDFFKKLEISEEKIKAMTFANYHRLPAEKGPKPIIVKFVTMEDRELVMSKAFHPVLREEKKRILSDLPVVMKRERGRLAKAAFKIRSEEKLKTRIVDKGLQVYLEVRKDTNQKWKRRDITVDEEEDSDVN